MHAEIDQLLCVDDQGKHLSDHPTIAIDLQDTRTSPGSDGR